MAARKAWVRVINGEPVCLDAQLPVPKPLDGVHTAQTVAYIPESELSALRAEHEAVLAALSWAGEQYARVVWRDILGHLHALAMDLSVDGTAETAVELLALLERKAE